MVELDESRLRRSAGNREGPKSVWDVIWGQWKRSDLSLGDKIHNVEAGIIGVAIGSLYQKLNKMGFSSGKEFATAISEAKALNANLVLGDRPVNETLIRLQQSIDKTGWSQDKGDKGDNAAIANTIEMLKERRTVRGIMQTLKENLPEVYTALIGERDQYMANSLLKANGRTTVAVVGMAHMDGIEAHLPGFVPTTCDVRP
ncbi:hypothetical protein GUITHDRAFT_136450 [Guillardia theta CCMP2712]|uniref:TraB family protein n=1 Tax=Guillardia theta (strain CCMP2712) TaxID=905079 RepID=L1JJY4_GUITC|nr:hypothetical protein GUITHDRAFT_136450 [Guillardia theta CCMP2712]EKX48781.1 hypothetical protein GUITHDRAFT_136450 [Guillardia theta CCMP2712]|eukprot:XP_005835761.1 hypothetical protein GUITHDRAFT_136450 [Guillardia theta CCMP2712]